MNNTNKTQEQLIREIEIRDALDRIELRAFSMQESDEISEVATVLFEEFRNLGFAHLRSGIAVLHEQDDEMEVWIVRNEGNMVPRGRMTLSDGFEIPQAKGGLTAWRQNAKHHILTFTGEEAADIIRSLEDYDINAQEESWPDQVYVHWFFFPNGYLFLTRTEQLNEEDLTTGERFAQVFGFAYTRFLDLQEKERRNQELVVEAALERIRSEVSAMQSTEDMGPVLGLIYQGANEVGLETTLVSITIIDDAQNTCQQFFLADADKIDGEPFRHNVYGKLDLYYTETTIPSFIGTILETEVGLIRHRAGEDRERIKREEEAHFDITISDDIYPRSRMFMRFSHGTIGFASTQPNLYSEEDFPIATRFAEMLSLGYARFLDFLRLDEQNNALQKANKRIQEATRLKSQFLATMSHELRTPMNSIIGFTRLVLRRSANLEDRQRENLEKVQMSADHLLNLINDILDLSKIEAGRIDIEPSTFNIKKLILNCCATVGPTLGKPSVALEYTIDDNIVDLHTDEARIRQIIINLLSNALKFTDEGSVTITATQTENAINVTINDTGIGIPEDQLETIFEEFRQVDGSNTRRHEGTGLGLAITRRLVQLLGGQLSVTSTLGEGSTFTFTIPQTYGTPLASSTLADNTIDAVLSDEGRIIVSIDDDPNIAVLIRQELQDDGYQVISALNADEGIDLVKKHKPLAVTVDILMPGKDGWQTISQLKADPETKDIPIIVVSAIENRSLGYSLGVQDYLVKPFTREDLVSALDNAMSDDIQKVLVVDDEAVANNLLCEMLDYHGIKTQAVYNGQEALDHIAKQKPDLIFLDLMMPVMDGFEVIQHLEKNDDWKDIPIIVVTAKDLTAEEGLFLKNHVNQIVQKGALEPDKLGTAIKEAIEKQKS